MKVKSTLLFGASGSFEEATIKKWKKLRVLAHKSPGTIKKGIPFTTYDENDPLLPIIRAQNGFRNIGYLRKVIAPYIKRGYQEYKRFPGELAEWTRDMMKLGMVWNTYGEAFYNIYQVPLAKGSLIATPVTILTANSSNRQFTYEFNPTVQYGQHEDDLLTLFLLAPLSIGSDPELVTQSLIFPRIQRRDQTPVPVTANDNVIIEPDNGVFLTAFWETNPARIGKKKSSTSNISEITST